MVANEKLRTALAVRGSMLVKSNALGSVIFRGHKSKTRMRARASFSFLFYIIFILFLTHFGGINPIQNPFQILVKVGVFHFIAYSKFILKNAGE